jgi:hypothetical protein
MENGNSDYLGGGLMSNFARAALIRAVKTVAQTAIAMIPASMMIQEVDWITVVSTSALAGVVSILTSIATDLPEAPKGGENG